MNPKFCCEKLARFGRITGRLASVTPIHFAIVAAYCSTEVVGINRPLPASVARSALDRKRAVIPSLYRAADDERCEPQPGRCRPHLDQRAAEIGAVNGALFAVLIPSIVSGKRKADSIWTAIWFGSPFADCGYPPIDTRNCRAAPSALRTLMPWQPSPLRCQRVARRRCQCRRAGQCCRQRCVGVDRTCVDLDGFAFEEVGAVAREHRAQRGGCSGGPEQRRRATGQCAKSHGTLSGVELKRLHLCPLRKTALPLTLST